MSQVFYKFLINLVERGKFPSQPTNDVCDCQEILGCSITDSPDFRNSLFLYPNCHAPIGEPHKNPSQIVQVTEKGMDSSNNLPLCQSHLT